MLCLTLVYVETKAEEPAQEEGEVKKEEGEAQTAAPEAPEASTQGEENASDKPEGSFVSSTTPGVV